MKKKGTFSVVFSFAKQCRGKTLASVLLDDETREICKEIVSCNALDHISNCIRYFLFLSLKFLVAAIKIKIQASSYSFYKGINFILCNTPITIRTPFTLYKE